MAQAREFNKVYAKQGRKRRSWHREKEEGRKEGGRPQLQTPPCPVLVPRPRLRLSHFASSFCLLASIQELAVVAWERAVLPPRKEKSSRLSRLFSPRRE